MQSIKRLLQIQFIILRYGLDDLLPTHRWLKPLRCLRGLNPYWLANRRLTRAQRLRLAIERLGPIFVKFGQLLSTRYDMLSEDVLSELAKLRDQVPAFSSKKASETVETALSASLTEVFASFDQEPLASGSIAQVHAATLQNGDPVVVKILRPNIQKTIKKDLALLRYAAKLYARYFAEIKTFNPVALINEVAYYFNNETHFMTEAANATQLKSYMRDNQHVHIPEIYWDYCRTDVLVMERVAGISIANTNALQQAGIDLKHLAKIGLETFFSQIFRDRFFHADLHPGNIFIEKTATSLRYVLVDFGIMGTLSENDQRYIAENLLAFLKRDYYRVAKLHVECGWVPADTRIDQFETALRAVCEPMFNRPIKDISMGSILVGLIQTARQFHMNIQPQLILLQKTLLQLEGLCRKLYPELNMWVTIKPIVEKWLKRKMGARALLSKIKQQLPYWLDHAPELPERIYQQLLTPHPQKTHESEQKKPSNRLVYLLFGFFTGLLLCLFNTRWLSPAMVNLMLGALLVYLIIAFVTDR